jgi:hypothetical protein
MMCYYIAASISVGESVPDYDPQFVACPVFGKLSFHAEFLQPENQPRLSLDEPNILVEAGMIGDPQGKLQPPA